MSLVSTLVALGPLAAAQPASSSVTFRPPVHLCTEGGRLEEPAVLSRYIFPPTYRREWGFPGGAEVKASACNVGDLGSIPGSGRSPGEGNSNPLQYSCLENPMDGGAWWVTVHGSQTVGHDWATSLHFHHREQEEPFPVRGKSHYSIYEWARCCQYKPSGRRKPKNNNRLVIWKISQNIKAVSSVLRPLSPPISPEVH